VFLTSSEKRDEGFGTEEVQRCDVLAEVGLFKAAITSATESRPAHLYTPAASPLSAACSSVHRVCLQPDIGVCITDRMLPLVYTEARGLCKSVWSTVVAISRGMVSLDRLA